MSEQVFCSKCKKEIHGDRFSTGYGVDKDENKVCFDCCGKLDKAELVSLECGKPMYLYLCKGYITNWPGTLKIRISGQRTGRHNIAGTQIHVWFSYKGREYHGVQCGMNTECCRVTALKEKISPRMALAI